METPAPKFLKILFALLFAAAFGLVGCQQQPLAPAQDQKVIRSGNELNFLQSTSMRLQKPFTTQQLVTAAYGGAVTTGDDSSGYSTLFFQPGDVPQDTLITFSWDSQGYITDLGPHGIVFNSPVQVWLSYKDADLTQVNEDSLQIWYYDPDADSWELIGGTVNKTEKRVEGYINHFSRYAIASGKRNRNH